MKFQKMFPMLILLMFSLTSCGNNSQQQEIDALREELESIKAETATTTTIQTTVSEPVTTTESTTVATSSATHCDSMGTMKYSSSGYGVSVTSVYVDDFWGTAKIGYEFYNGSENSISFSNALIAPIYQNGIKCSSSSWLSEETDTTIKSGVTLTVYKTYELRDVSSPIDIEVYEQDWLFGDKLFYEYTYTINKPVYTDPPVVTENTTTYYPETTINASTQPLSDKAPVGLCDDSYKSITDDLRRQLGLPTSEEVEGDTGFDDMNSNLYFIFYDNEKEQHNLWQIAQLAAKNSGNLYMTAEDYYVLLNNAWYAWDDVWNFSGSVGDDFVIGLKGEMSYDILAVIPYEEYKPYLNRWFFM
ncbi:MAG: DUF5067 domain-containing protein [Huintestinicola sp.]